MLKMLLDPMGGIVLTNDGNAILREVSWLRFERNLCNLKFSAALISPQQLYKNQAKKPRQITCLITTVISSCSLVDKQSG